MLNIHLSKALSFLKFHFKTYPCLLLFTALFTMATLKSRTLTQLTELTDCCICLKTFTDPRTLPCIHTFCFQCLHEMFDKSDKKPGVEIQCPMCRSKSTLPIDGVQGIQKNFFMAGLIEVRSALNQSMTAIITCDACTANNDD